MTIRETITTKLVEAFGEWGAFTFMNQDKNPKPDGSHITKKYTNQILKSIREALPEECNGIGVSPGERNAFNKCLNQIKDLLK